MGQRFFHQEKKQHTRAHKAQAVKKQEEEEWQGLKEYVLHIYTYPNVTI